MPPKNPPKKVTKRTAKPVHLSVSQKLELLRKIDGGMSVAQVCELYGVKKQTVSDIKKARGKLENYAVKFAVSGKGDATRKHMKDPKCVELDLAVYKWYTQERACGVEVRGVELAASAAKLAAHMGIEFKASDGWLWRFRRRHGIRNLAVTGEAESADAEMIEPFRDELMKLINDEDLSMSQIYNVDETGMMWRALPRNTQAGMHEKKVKGKKVSKERLSVLCGGNASGTHRLKLTVVGKAAKPRALKDIMDKLPVHYYNSSKAWFNSHIFTDYFQHHLVPEVKNYQEKVLKIRPDDVKALILLDNAPAHPSSDVLKSADGKIKAMFLPKNTTSLIQPMDQGVISAFKRIYLRKYLDDVLVVLETEDDAVEDTRGKRTLANIKNYNIRAAIYNMYEAWTEMKHTTFTNAWKKLMKDEDYCADFEGFEATDFHQLLKKSGEEEVTVDDVDEWLEENDQTQGNEILNTEQIVAAVTGEESDSEDSDSGEVKPTVKMSVVRECADVLLKFVEDCSRQDIQIHYDQLRLLRSKIIRMQHESGRQTLIKEFFKVSKPDTTATATATATTTTANTATATTTTATATTTTATTTTTTSPQPGPSGEHLRSHDSSMEVVSDSE